MRGAITGLYVLDVVDPLHPVQVCQLINASSGRFISATKIAFWYSTFVGTADLQTGNLNWSRAFLNPPSAMVFSPDGSSWAYREGDDAGTRTHLVAGGTDQVLLTRQSVAADSGAAFGPVEQLVFSATGQYLLTSTLLAEAGELPNFVVFALDGSVLFRSTTAKYGTWDRSGNRLYFLVATNAAAFVGTVESLDPGGQPVVRSPKLSSYFWPTLSSDGRTLVFNAYGAQGLPHPWKLDIPSRGRVQLSSATSTQPVFVGQGVVWSNEGIACKCGLGETSEPDGRVIAHNLSRHLNSVVGEMATLSSSKSPTNDILDVWFG